MNISYAFFILPSFFMFLLWKNCLWKISYSLKLTGCFSTLGETSPPSCCHCETYPQFLCLCWTVTTRMWTSWVLTCTIATSSGTQSCPWMATVRKLAVPVMMPAPPLLSTPHPPCQHRERSPPTLSSTSRRWSSAWACWWAPGCTSMARRSTRRDPMASTSTTATETLSMSPISRSPTNTFPMSTRASSTSSRGKPWCLRDHGKGNGVKKQKQFSKSLIQTFDLRLHADTVSFIPSLSISLFIEFPPVVLGDDLWDKILNWSAFVVVSLNANIVTRSFITHRLDGTILSLATWTSWLVWCLAKASKTTTTWIGHN